MNKVRSTTIVAIVIATIGAISGDAAMLLVVGFARQLSPHVYIQLLLSTVAITIGAYLFFGLPQLKAWEKDQNTSPSDDFRTRWSLRLLGSNNRKAFFLASIIGGPLAVGYAAGYTHDAHGHRKTFISAIIMAAFWAALYLGAFNGIESFLNR